MNWCTHIHKHGLVWGRFVDYYGKIQDMEKQILSIGYVLHCFIASINAKLITASDFNASLAQVHSFRASQLRSFTASQLQSFRASELHSFVASQLHSFIASQLRSFQGFIASQLHSFVASQLHSFQLRSFNLLSFVASQLHRFLMILDLFGLLQQLVHSPEYNNLIVC